MTNEDKNEEIMIEIGNTLVSLDLAERFFAAISTNVSDNAA